MNAPVRLPRIGIELDGAALSPLAGASLLGLRVQQRLSLPTLCELSFPAKALTGAMPRLGAPLRVTVQGQTDELFAGSVTAIDHLYGPARGCDIRIRAYDALFALRQRQPVRAHLHQTLPALARELTADLGLEVDAESDGPLWQRLIQTGSDFDLLADMAQRCGMYFALRGATLHLFSLSGLGAPLPLHFGRNLFEARVELNLAGACAGVKASAWDPWHAGARGARASVARSGRELEGCSEPARSGERTMTGLALQDDGQAEALAQAALDAGAAQAVVLWGVAEGDPALRPGARVQLAGVAPGVAGSYVLTGATHTLDPRRGLQTELSSMPPPTPRPDGGAGSALGVVTRVDDPEQLRRIQVSLPAFGDVETDWLPVLAPGAGAGKGLLAWPDVGDVVLLLLAARDPTQAVVLGGVHSAERLPHGEDKIGDGASFSFVSPGGHKLRLDDGANTVRVEHRGGSFLEMTPERVRLHAAGTLEIGAPGQQVFIRGQRIDFERT